MKTIVEVAQNLIKPFINSEDKKYAANIAPVETSPATAAHAAGTQLIYNGVLYNVTANIAADDPLATTGAGANIAVADKVTEQISSQKQALNDYQNYYGSKNILSFAKLATVNPFVQNNITYTFHENTGIINIVSSGTSSGLTSPYVYLPTFDKNTDVIVSVEGIDSTKNDYLVYDYTAATTLINGTTEQTVTIPANHTVGISIRSFSGKTFNEIVKPMIRVCGDNTFVPFAKPNTELTKDDSGLTANAFANGAVNEFPIETSSYTHPNGVTFVVNADKSISCSGTATASITFYLTANYTGLVNGRHHLSGCPTGGGYGDTYALGLAANGASVNLGRDEGNGVDITFDKSTQNNVSMYIWIKSGQNMNGKVFKPMITVADMPNSDYDHYVPYRMSNGELTDYVTQHSFGTAVDLSSQSSYECPSDGYVAALVEIPQSNAYVTVNGIVLLQWSSQSAAAAIRQSVFVRKGMTIAKAGTFSEIKFYPLA